MRWTSPGWWTEVIAGSHMVVAAVLHGRAYGEMARDGLLSAVPDHGPRAEAFWFAVPAPLLWLTGRVVRSAEASEDVDTQRAAGWVLAVTGAAGSVLMPRSPFWLVLAAGLGSLRRARAGAASARRG